LPLENKKKITYMKQNELTLQTNWAY